MLKVIQTEKRESLAVELSSNSNVPFSARELKRKTIPELLKLANLAGLTVTTNAALDYAPKHGLIRGNE